MKITVGIAYAWFSIYHTEFDADRDECVAFANGWNAAKHMYQVKP